MAELRKVCVRGALTCDTRSKTNILHWFNYRKYFNQENQLSGILVVKRGKGIGGRWGSDLYMGWARGGLEGRGLQAWSSDQSVFNENVLEPNHTKP